MSSLFSYFLALLKIGMYMFLPCYITIFRTCIDLDCMYHDNNHGVMGELNDT